MKHLLWLLLWIVLFGSCKGNADTKGMESDATTLASKIKIGWNLGNSLEAIGGETAWGNPAATQELIDLVKENGFNAVRIPCNWHSGYIDNETTCTIDPEWLARVSEVVDYCVNRDMYAIINIHWDGGWLDENPTYEMQKEVNRKLALLWTQIATHFCNYDEHLLFAGTNEVHVSGIYDNKLVTPENHEVQQSFNQTFVDAVRATGGKNVYRNLVIQAYNTNIELAVNHLKMPNDIVPNRLMVEIHFYDPYDYTLGKTTLYWGWPYKALGVSHWGQEEHVDTVFAALKKRFADNGIPVILGEYGVDYKARVDEDMVYSRVYWLEYVTRTAKVNGIVPF